MAALRALCGRIGIAVVACVAVTVGAVYEVNHYIDQRVSEIKRVAVVTAPPSGHGMNFLIVGSDSRDFVRSKQEAQAFTDATTTVGGPARSDTMMVLHADGNRSYAVSFPRDLWVDIPGRGQSKINAAFNDGPQKVVDTLKQNFDVDVNHYLEVDFKTFQEVVNAVGSVPVYFPAPVRDQYSGLGPTVVAGCYHLDGSAALAYVRSRHLQYYDPTYTDSKTGEHWKPADPLSDLDRIQRQQSFTKKLGRIAVQQTFDHPLLAPDIVNGIIPNLKADRGFDRAALDALVRAFMGLSVGNEGGLTFQTLPWDGPNRRSGQDVLLVKYPEADAVLAVLRGQAVAPTPTTSTVATSSSGTAPAVRPVDVRVKVLNGSGKSGAAGDAATAFSRLGFPSGGVGNDSRGLVDRTEVRYQPGDEAKAQLVSGSVPGAQLVPDSALSGTDVVVVLGKDFTRIGTTSPAVPTSTATATTVSPEAACN